VALRDPFARRIAWIQTFMEVPPLRILELVRPPDLSLLTRKLLARLADDPGDPHAQIHVEPTVTGYRRFFAEVVEAVAAAAHAARDDVEALGIEFPPVPAFATSPDIDGHGEDVAAGRHAHEKGESGGPRAWARATGQWLSRVGDALPPEAGSLVVILEPELRGRGAREALGWAVAALGLHLRSERVKLILVHVGPADLVPPRDALADAVIRVDLAVPPDEMEDQLQRDLEGGALAPGETRRMRLLAGAFAVSGARFDEGEALLRETLAEARTAEAVGEEANVLYNLGDLYARTHRHEEAAEVLTDAARAALETGNDGLAAMALTNLGVALYHEGRGREAVASLDAARGLFRALGHRPGEAHAVDCTARVWVASDPERARALWHEAGDLYDGIAAPHLQEVREAGRADVDAKLARLPGGAAGGGG
jgi:tetratricopeptide (TPR) repeat protein